MIYKLFIMVVQLWNIDSLRRMYIGAHGMKILTMCNTNHSNREKTDMCIGGGGWALLLMGDRRLEVIWVGGSWGRVKRWCCEKGGRERSVIDWNFNQSSYLIPSPFPLHSYALATASHSLPLKHSAVYLEYISPPLTRFLLVFHPLHTSGCWSSQFSGPLHPRSSPQALVLPH